jgi:hypothetical protein
MSGCKITRSGVLAMKRILLGVLCATVATPALAVDKLYSPYVEKGEWEVEYYFDRSVDSDPAKDNVQGHEFSLGYGVNDWWKTEVVATAEKLPTENVKFGALEWENVFQLTRKGEYWLDIGALVTYKWTPESRDVDALETKLLLSKEIGRTYHLANLTLEKDIGPGAGTVQGGLAMSSRYRWNPYFEPGVELHSEFGELNHTGSLSSHEHYLGPVAYGTIPLEHEGKEIEGVKYRAGYLWGISRAASDGQIVLQVEYGF